MAQQAYQPTRHRKHGYSADRRHERARRMQTLRYEPPRVLLWTDNQTPATHHRECARRLHQRATTAKSLSVDASLLALGVDVGA